MGQVGNKILWFPFLPRQKNIVEYILLIIEMMKELDKMDGDFEVQLIQSVALEQKQIIHPIPTRRKPRIK